jgi:hypothetical protein
LLRGFLNVHYYYIPIKTVEGWDENVLWVKITEEEVKKNMKEIQSLIQTILYKRLSILYRLY